MQHPELGFGSEDSQLYCQGMSNGQPCLFCWTPVAFLCNINVEWPELRLAKHIRDKQLGSK
eukprot:scaffold242564_cov20-Prasinocladus_malaysianus.AAC.1